jgi:hypothetical protein
VSLLFFLCEPVDPTGDLTKPTTESHHCVPREGRKRGSAVRIAGKGLLRGRRSGLAHRKKGNTHTAPSTHQLAAKKRLLHHVVFRGARDVLAGSGCVVEGEVCVFVFDGSALYNRTEGTKERPFTYIINSRSTVDDLVLYDYRLLPVAGS